MKKKYFLASAAVLALGLGTYGLIQWQAQPRPQTKDNKVAYIEDKASGDKLDKNLTSDQVNDEEGIEAVFENGVLEVNIPKKEERKSFQIEVKKKKIV